VSFLNQLVSKFVSKLPCYPKPFIFVFPLSLVMVFPPGTPHHVLFTHLLN
jgi:hypothetical protein